MSSQPPENQPPEKQAPSRRALLIGVGAVVILVLASTLPIRPALSWTAGELASWGPLGTVLFVLGYAVATALFLPRSALTLLAGLGWGFTDGSLIALLGSLLAAAGSFAIGRWLLSRSADALARRHAVLAALDSVARQQPVRLTVLWHLSLVLPYSLINYWMGAARVDLRAFFLGKILGIVPSTLVWTWFGTLLGDLAAFDNGAAAPDRWRLWLGVVGVTMTAVTLVWLARAARRALASLPTAA